MKSHLRDLLSRAIAKTAKGGGLREADLPPLVLEAPKQKEFGDLASNVALVWAKKQKKSPRAVAEEILRNLEDPGGILEKVDVAGPGFLNFTFSAKFCCQLLREKQEAREPALDLGQGKKIQLEFASVNPTGPLHVGHGRVAVIGDALARLLAAVGYDIEREYYVNDAGQQMEKLGISVYQRYRELYGSRDPFPEDAYPGEYVKELALEVQQRWGDRFLKEEKGEAVSFLSRYGGEALLAQIRDDLDRFGVIFDSYVSERVLRERGEVEETIALLRSRELIYQQDGAHWFKATQYGDDKDRTVIKSDGELTYFASDIAYHRNKLRRGFSRLINVWGADHHGYVQRLKAAIKALGHDPELLQVVLVQMVHLTRGGEPVRMGKRLGEFVTLKEVLEEVGRDAARFFFLMRRPDSHLDFDLELAKKESSENPVFYVQYAHARIASIFEQARQAGLPADDFNNGNPEIDRLALPEEVELLKRVIQFHDVIEECVRELEPHRMVFYLLDLAGEFHRYYNRFRVISDDRSLSRARLTLVSHVQKVIRDGLHLLGIEAPVRMASRSDPGLKQV
ncbi:MAG: arginine--tRNA ligase [Deltaproteobacteria bacterium]|nr:arginine--tRNA ligase [Deltaproteobacteria bacterium]